MTRAPSKWLVPMLSLALWTACKADPGGAEAPANGIVVEIAPLGLEGMFEAGYHLVAKNAAGVIVWEDDVTTAIDGDGAGQLSYTGPCSASEGPYRIELTLLWLRDDVGVLPSGSYIDPTASGPLVLETACPEVGAATVSFDVTILGLRREFEVSMHLDDIFCSAKFDCIGEAGGPISLLIDPATDERSTTVILAFACTSGQGQPTTLHMNDLYVACDDGTRYWIDPTGGESTRDGQMGPQEPLFFERASFRGREQLPGYDKCYWNLALGLDLVATTGGCHLEASATASSGPLPSGGAANTMTLYPYVHWSIDLSEGGQLACGKNALGVTGSGTQADYVELSRSPFAHAMECATTTITTPPRVLCSGGVQATDAAVSVTATVGGVFVEAGADKSQLYRLPPGMDVPDCCVSPCCAGAAP